MSFVKKWTGERLLTDITNEPMLEHLHRYAIASELVKDKIVLDLASGEGYGTNLLAQHAESVVGVDISIDAVSLAKKKYVAKNLQFVNSSADSLPFQDDFFDVVVSFETIEHLTNQIGMLSEIKRVLKKNGILIISSPDKLYYSDQRNYFNEYHVKELYSHEFYSLIKNFFLNIKLYYQKIAFSSVISTENTMLNLVEYTGDFGGISKSEILTTPLYNIIIASDEESRLLPNSIFDGNFVLNDKIVDFEKRLSGDIVFSILHIDVNSGYDIKKMLVCKEQFKQHFDITYDLSDFEVIDGFRWDPINNSACKVRFEKIILEDFFGNKSEYSLSQIRNNGQIADDGMFEFMSHDPNIYIDIAGKFNSIQFIGDWQIIKNLELDFHNFKKINDLNASIAFLKSEKQSLLSENESYLKRIEELSKDIHIFEDEKKLSDERITNLTLRTEELSKDIHIFEDEKKLSDERITNLTLRTEELSKDIHIFEDEKKLSDERITNLTLRTEELSKDIHIYKSEIESLSLTIKSIKNSNSYLFVRSLEDIAHFKHVRKNMKIVFSSSLRVFKKMILRFVKKNSFKKSISEIEKFQSHKNLNYAVKNKISIIMLSFNRWEDTLKSIKYLYKNYSYDFEVIILDNNSDKKTKTKLRKISTKYKNLKIYFEDTNLGCAGGRKKAFHYSSSEYVLFIDNDVLVLKNSIENLVQRLEEDENIAGVCCKVVFPDGKIQYNGGEMVVDDEYALYSLIDGGKMYNDYETESFCDCMWIPGGATIWKRTVLEKFEIDDNMHGSFEDNEVCYRIKKAGFSLLNSPHSIVIHNHYTYKKKSFVQKEESYLKGRYNSERVTKALLTFYKKHQLIFSFAWKGNPWDYMFNFNTKKEIVDFIKSNME